MAYVILDPNNNVICVFAAPQPGNAEVTQIADNDPRIAAFQNPPAAQLAKQIAAGITITSTGTPALNGTYAVDDPAQHVISGTAAGIAARNRLPGGGSTFGYGDINGVRHDFTATAFLNFAAAVEDYIYALYAAVEAGQPLPAASATIA